jgi:hypothetical protein
MPPTENNSEWVKHSVYVLKSIEGLSGDIDRVERKLDALRDDVIMLKVKAGIYGGVAAAVVSAVIGIIARAVWK